MKSLKALLLTAILALALLAAGCGSKEAEKGKAPQAEGDKMKVAFASSRKGDKTCGK